MEKRINGHKGRRRPRNTYIEEIIEMGRCNNGYSYSHTENTGITEKVVEVLDLSLNFRSKNVFSKKRRNRIDDITKLYFYLLYHK